MGLLLLNRASPKIASFINYTPQHEGTRTRARAHPQCTHVRAALAFLCLSKSEFALCNDTVRNSSNYIVSGSKIVLIIQYPYARQARRHEEIRELHIFTVFFQFYSVLPRIRENRKCRA